MNVTFLNPQTFVLWHQADYPVYWSIEEFCSGFEQFLDQMGLGKVIYSLIKLQCRVSAVSPVMFSNFCSLFLSFALMLYHSYNETLFFFITSYRNLLWTSPPSRARQCHRCTRNWEQIKTCVKEGHSTNSISSFFFHRFWVPFVWYHAKTSLVNFEMTWCVHFVGLALIFITGHMKAELLELLKGFISSTKENFQRRVFHFYDAPHLKLKQISLFMHWYKR